MKGFGQLALAHHIYKNKMYTRAFNMFIVIAPSSNANQEPTKDVVDLDETGKNVLKCNCVLGRSGAPCCHRMAIEFVLHGSTTAEPFDVDLQKCKKQAAGKGAKKSGKKGGQEVETQFMPV